MKSARLNKRLKICLKGRKIFGGIFDYDIRKEQLTEVELELGEPAVWDDPGRAQELGKQRAALDIVVSTIDKLTVGVSDVAELLEMAVEEDDADTVMRSKTNYSY